MWTDQEFLPMIEDIALNIISFAIVVKYISECKENQVDELTIEFTYPLVFQVSKSILRKKLENSRL